MMTPVSVGAAIGASFGFLRAAWSGAWGALMLLVWFGASLQAVLLARPDLAPFYLLGLVLLLVAATVAIGALYRLGLAPDHGDDPAFALGPAGLQWRALEWRVLGANVIVGLLIGGGVLVLAFVVGLFLGFAAIGQGGEGGFARAVAGPAGIMAFLLAIPAVVAIVWLAAKLSLLAVTAADLGRIDFGKAWGLTHGALTAIIVTSIVIAGAQVAAFLLVGLVAGVAGGALGGGASAAGLWFNVGGQAAGAAINAPLVAGLQLYVYRTRRGDLGVAQTFA